NIMGWAVREHRRGCTRYRFRLQNSTLPKKSDRLYVVLSLSRCQASQGKSFFRRGIWEEFTMLSAVRAGFVLRMKFRLGTGELERIFTGLRCMTWCRISWCLGNRLGMG